MRKEIRRDISLTDDSSVISCQNIQMSLLCKVAMVFIVLCTFHVIVCAEIFLRSFELAIFQIIAECIAEK